MVRAVYDPNEEKNEKKLARQQRQRELGRKLERDEALKALMQHRQGRRYIYWLLSLGHLGRNPFHHNALDTSFACGELNVAQQIQAHVMETCPTPYLTMLQEHEDERLADTRSDESGEAPGDDS